MINSYDNPLGVNNNNDNDIAIINICAIALDSDEVT